MQLGHIPQVKLKWSDLQMCIYGCVYAINHAQIQCIKLVTNSVIFPWRNFISTWCLQMTAMVLKNLLVDELLIHIDGRCTQLLGTSEIPSWTNTSGPTSTNWPTIESRRECRQWLCGRWRHYKSTIYLILHSDVIRISLDLIPASYM